MAKNTRSFKYQRRSTDDVKERANAKGGNFDTFVKPQFKRYKIKEGKNLIRILPPTWDKAKHYGYDIHVNYSIGIDNQSYLSLSEMKGEKDPLEEARREAQRDGDEKLAKALRPQRRILMWIIDRLDEDEGPQLMDAPFTLDKSIANISLDEDTKDVIYIDDPEEGCDLRFYREGTGLTTKYDASRMKLLKTAPISEDEKQQQEWLDYITENPVPDCLQFYDYDHISSTFSGVAGRRDEDEDADEKPQRRKPSNEDDDEPRPRNRRAEAEDEDEKPRSRSRLKDDESDEDEDEHPTPRRGATSRASKDDDDEPAEDAKQKGGSIRERIAARNRASVKVDDDEEDD